MKKCHDTQGMVFNYINCVQNSSGKDALLEYQWLRNVTASVDSDAWWGRFYRIHCCFCHQEERTLVILSWDQNLHQCQLQCLTVQPKLEHVSSLCSKKPEKKWLNLELTCPLSIMSYVIVNKMHVVKYSEHTVEIGTAESYSTI